MTDNSSDYSFFSSSVEQTIAIAKEFARRLQSNDVVIIQGGLGVGKTHFTKGLASYFGVKQEYVLSPTYAVVHEYLGQIPLYHFDLYRLSYAEEVEYLGAEEYFSSANLCLIEWPERGLGSIPAADLVIEIIQSGIGRSVNCTEQSKKGSKIIKRLTEKGRNL